MEYLGDEKLTEETLEKYVKGIYVYDQKPYRCGGNRSCSAREKSAGTERRDLTKPCSARSWEIGRAHV